MADLRCDAIDEVPIILPLTRGSVYFTMREAVFCEECNHVVISENNECPECYNQTGYSEIMTDRYWPLPHFDSSWLEELKDNQPELLEVWSLCGIALVEIQEEGDEEYCALDFLDQNETWGLCLLGCGQDMSWDIAGGYVAMGFCPPVTIARRLPNFAGKTMTKKTKRVLDACEKSLKISMEWNEWGLKTLSELKKVIVANTK